MREKKGHVSGLPPANIICCYSTKLKLVFIHTQNNHMKGQSTSGTISLMVRCTHLFDHCRLGSLFLQGNYGVLVSAGAGVVVIEELKEAERVLV